MNKIKTDQLAIIRGGERQLTTIDGKEYLNQTAKMYYNSNDSAGTDNILKISKTKDGKQYSIESMAPEQKKMWSWL